MSKICKRKMLKDPLDLMVVDFRICTRPIGGMTAPANINKQTL